MNTWITQQWYGELSQQTCDEIDAAVAALEKKVSLYLPESEVSMINAAAGREYVPVSEEVYKLIKECTKVCEEYNGLFDITVAPLSILWDVTGENPSVPDGEDIKTAQSLVDYRKILFNESERSVMLADEGMQIDLGGAAKGWAVTRVREIAEKNGVSGYLSVGGNMLVVGKKPDRTDYIIGLRDPYGKATDYFAKVVMDGYTMATTGGYERYFEQDGKRYHHVLDPFTGFPSDKGIAAVTVLSKDGLLADCLSTAIFLMGEEYIEEAISRTDCMVLVVDEDRNVYASEGFWEHIEPVSGSSYKFDRP